MIKCIIDGSTAYPELKNNIKITYANPYVHDSGSYTYQITFPMSIMENRKLFRNVSRFEVGKRLPDYEECQLYYNNRLLISGKGTVTSITQDSVKLQIVGGKSRIKFNSEMTCHFIDEIQAYDTVQLPTEQARKLVRIKDGPLMVTTLYRIGSDTDTILLSSTFIGNKDQQGRPMYAFNPTWDETNDRTVNRIAILDGTAWLWRPAVQPYLLYVLRKVLEYEGFTLQRNDLDREPWDRLVICSARQGTDIRLALPHWTVYTFIEEVRKLFNVTFKFNELSKTVDIVSTNEVISNDAVSYLAADEYSVEYDEDGMKNIIVSNLQYDFPDSANRSGDEIIPTSLFKKFKHLVFDDYNDMQNAWSAATKKEKMTTIYQVGERYYISVIDEETFGDSNPYMSEVGVFTPLIRNADSDEYEGFSIVPVAVYRDKLSNLFDEVDFLNDQTMLSHTVFLPSITNEKEAEGGSPACENEEYYTTVQEALADESLVENKEENTDEKMQVMFQAQMLQNTFTSGTVFPESTIDSSYRQFRYPSCFTGTEKYYIFIQVELASLSLHDRGNAGSSHIVSIGDLHGTIPADTHNLMTIRFLTDEIPDPSNIFIFRNKKFICQKVELEVSENGIDPVKAGYFYELK